MSAALAPRAAPVRQRRVVQPVVTPARNSASRPYLHVVKSAPRSRYSKMTIVVFTLASAFALVVVFQTVIAAQQLRLDKVSTNVRLARIHYDDLRQQRAELRAPDNLRTQAMMLGMSQGLSAKFEEVPAEIVASVLAATGSMDQQFSKPQIFDDLLVNADAQSSDQP